MADQNVRPMPNCLFCGLHGLGLKDRYRPPMERDTSRLLRPNLALLAAFILIFQVVLRATALSREAHSAAVDRAIASLLCAQVAGVGLAHERPEQSHQAPDCCTSGSFAVAMDRRASAQSALIPFYDLTGANVSLQPKRDCLDRAPCQTAARPRGPPVNSRSYEPNSANSFMYVPPRGRLESSCLSN